MTPREQSKLINGLLGHALIWAGFVILAIVLIHGSVTGITLMQLVTRVLIATVVGLAGFGIEESA